MVCLTEVDATVRRKILCLAACAGLLRPSPSVVGAQPVNADQWIFVSAEIPQRDPCPEVTDVAFRLVQNQTGDIDEQTKRVEDDLSQAYPLGHRTESFNIGAGKSLKVAIVGRPEQCPDGAGRSRTFLAKRHVYGGSEEHVLSRIAVQTRGDRILDWVNLDQAIIATRLDLLKWRAARPVASKPLRILPPATSRWAFVGFTIRERQGCIWGEPYARSAARWIKRDKDLASTVREVRVELGGGQPADVDAVYAYDPEDSQPIAALIRREYLCAVAGANAKKRVTAYEWIIVSNAAAVTQAVENINRKAPRDVEMKASLIQQYDLREGFHQIRLLEAAEPGVRMRTVAESRG